MTGEQFCQVGDISLCYEGIGDPQAEHTVVLIMGLGLQMVWWRDDFCAELAGAVCGSCASTTVTSGTPPEFGGPVYPRSDS